MALRAGDRQRAFRGDGIGVGDEIDVLMEATANGLRDVFELKRPDMDVIHYDRTHKCWYWSSDTVKAIAQCHRYLDVLHELSARRLRDRPEIAAYHPRAVIIVGRSAAWTEDQHQALHGLNARLHAITVMTYDFPARRSSASRSGSHTERNRIRSSKVISPRL